MPGPADGTSRHLLTVALEDYFQVGAFNRLIQRGEWYRFESRVDRSTRYALDLLDHHKVKATFFCLGWIAEQMPEVIAQVAARGHEIGSRGYYHRSIVSMSPAEFRDDLARARESLRRASGQPVLGYRVADGWFGPGDLWALQVLAEEGYRYDSSIGPVLRRFAAEPWRRFSHVHREGEASLWEFPVSAARVLGQMIPISGGNWFRQLPHWLVRRAVDHWIRTYESPFVMYFHVWELDSMVPKISAAPWLQRVRAYRNLDRMPELIRYYLERYQFTSVADYLGLETRTDPAPERVSRAARPVPLLPRQPAPAEETERVPVTLVVPCYNEELILPYLANTLRSVESRLGGRYQFEFLFVDDASTDDTAAALERTFGEWPGARVLRHPTNRGVAGAIGTGLRQARHPVVCSIDCDCTYDPHLLDRMIPLLAPGVDLVTASPYHPEGTVRNVPEWRLVLSRTLSACYRRVLHHRLFTYTSCFRVYRRDAVKDIQLRETAFLGVAELLGRLDLEGGTIVEFPATLQVRMLGRSKMKILRTIVGHLGLLARLAWLRLRGRPGVPAGPEVGDLSVSPDPETASRG